MTQDPFRMESRFRVSSARSFTGGMASSLQSVRLRLFLLCFTLYDVFYVTLWLSLDYVCNFCVWCAAL